MTAIPKVFRTFVILEGREGSSRNASPQPINSILLTIKTEKLWENISQNQN